MKKTIAVFIITLCCANMSFAVETDSLNRHQKPFKRNEIGISAYGMCNLTKPTSAFAVNYKYMFNKYAIRLNAMVEKQYSDFQYFRHAKLNDSLCSVYNYRNCQLSTSINAGMEKYSSISDLTTVFWGADIHYSIDKRSDAVDSLLYLNSSVYNTNGAAVYNINGVTAYNNAPYGEFSTYRHRIGISPVIGLTQKLNPSFSATIEFALLVDMTTEDKQMASNIDNRLKLSLNYCL